MKRLLSICICWILSIFPSISSGRAEATGPAIEHIFTHELVYDTAKAFSPDNSLRVCFDRDHMTTDEFGKLLNELYGNGYALIGLERSLSGEFELGGKKPLVMSFDDMTYDTRGRGVVEKIVVKDGMLYDYTKDESPEYTRERENITILESFIERHPDFAPYGEKATVCVNGYNGVLGYRFTPDCGVGEARAESEAKEFETLVAAMKERGYTFASHTYSHKYFKDMSAADIERDCAKWHKYVEPLVGKTRVLCFPAGDHSAKAYKFGIYPSYGFDVFLCVGGSANAYEKKLPYDFVYRKPFDGTALRLYKKQYAHLVDTEKIYDKKRFRSFEYKGSY